MGDRGLAGESESVAHPQVERRPARGLSLTANLDTEPSFRQQTAAARSSAASPHLALPSRSSSLSPTMGSQEQQASEAIRPLGELVGAQQTAADQIDHASHDVAPQSQIAGGRVEQHAAIPKGDDQRMRSKYASAEAMGTNTTNTRPKEQHPVKSAYIEDFPIAPSQFSPSRISSGRVFENGIGSIPAGTVDPATAARGEPGSSRLKSDILNGATSLTDDPANVERDPFVKRSRRPHSQQRMQPEFPSAFVEGLSPASAMYYSRLPYYGNPPRQPLRAHTGTLVGDRIWFIGGVDNKHCWREVAYLDTENLCWATVPTNGHALPPLRAHTTTLVGNMLYIFGGGDGPTYSNEVWIFDIASQRFSRPNIVPEGSPIPPPRRAHTTILYRNYLVVFGGGNGQTALNDVWALNISDPANLSWQEWKASGHVPQKKGYHTANLVGDKMLVFGGSDGHASFADIHVLDLRTLVWKLLDTDIKHNRLSHTSTQVGSYLFVLGGHNGQTYAQDVLLFNLVTLQWETKIPKGHAPAGRGYHVALLHDARIIVFGGYNGASVFDDLWAIELAGGAYLPQVTTFEVDDSIG